MCPLIGLFDEHVTHFGCYLDSALLTLQSRVLSSCVFFQGVSQAVFLTKINIICMLEGDAPCYKCIIVKQPLRAKKRGTQFFQ